jgi:hypothetical protein
MRRILLSLAVLGMMVLLMDAGVRAQTHTANQIIPGAFGSGAWSFPSSVSVNGLTLNDADIIDADEIKGLNDLRLYGDGSGGPDIQISPGGNVGIGVAPGTSRLTVSGGIYVQGNIQATGTICNATACIGAGGGEGTVNPGAVNKIAYYPAAGDTVDDFTGASNGALYYDGSGILRSATLPVTSGGIGATSLNDLITLGTHTTGDYVSSVTGGTTDTITVSGTAGENWEPTIDVTGDSIDGEQLADSITLDANLDIDSNTLYIDASSNEVGVGTNSPGARLHIEADSEEGLRLISDYGNTHFGWNGISNYITHSTSGAFYVRRYTGSYHLTPDFTVDADGQVGIGMTSPDDKLDIRGGNLDMNDNNIEGVNRLYTASIYGLSGSNIVIRLS